MENGMIRRYILLLGILSAFFIFNNTIFALEKGQPILSKYLSKLESTAGKGKAEKKIGGPLKLQIQLKNSYKEQPTPERLNTMQKMGMRTEEIDKHLVFIHLKEKLSPSKVAELKKIGVIVYEDSWIPPLKNHPTGYVIASMPVDRLYDLAEKPFVVKLETAEQKLEPKNDEAAMSIHADSVWNSGYNGSGVKIAVLDSGLDTTHKDIPTPLVGKDFSGYPLIDDNIENIVTEHGTHVTGSALGRGTLSNGKYKGMSYGADLIFLKIGNDTTGSANTSAISSAIKAARDQYSADIITMSYGGFDIYNDGSDENCQAVDYAFGEGALVFISAGNEASDGTHYSGTVSGNGTTDFIKVDVSGNATQGLLYFYLNWFDGQGVNNDLDLSLFDANKIEIASATLIVREQQGESSKGTEAEIFYLNVDVPGPATFYLKVRNNANSEQFFHIYSLDSYTTFENADAAYTVGSPAVADNAIAVASYVTRTSWTDYTGQGWLYTNATIDSISSFSSRGPRNDGTKKPDIATPGQGIISARDKIVTWPGSEDSNVIDNDGINDGNGPADYLVAQGTSMACPIAAGAAALLMQAEPSLKGNPSRVRNALFQTASNSGTQDTTFGYGKMDILAALNYVLSTTPTPTATSTPTPAVTPTPTPSSEKGSISGDVIDTEGFPIESAKIKLKGKQTKVSKRTTSDGDGTFEFNDLSADIYIITATRKGYRKGKEVVSLGKGEDADVEIEMEKKISSRY